MEERNDLCQHIEKWSLIGGLTYLISPPGTPTLSFETSMLMFVDSLSKRLWRVPVKRCEHCTQSVLHSLVLSVLLCLLLILYILNLLSMKEFCLHSVLRYNNNINHHNAGFVSQPSRLQKTWYLNSIQCKSLPFDFWIETHGYGEQKTFWLAYSWAAKVPRTWEKILTT